MRHGVIPVTIAALILLAYAGTASAEPLLGYERSPRLHFDIVQNEAGESRYALGINLFSRQQIAQFVTAVAAFLERAEALGPGEMVVLRQEGLTGYLAVSARRAGAETLFTLTLRAEAPAAVAGPAALRAFAAQLGGQVLSSGPQAR